MKRLRRPSEGLEEIIRDGLPRRVARATLPTKNEPANTSRLEAYLCVCITPNCLASVFHGDRFNECFLRKASWRPALRANSSNRWRRYSILQANDCSRTLPNPSE